MTEIMTARNRTQHGGNRWANTADRSPRDREHKDGEDHEEVASCCSSLVAVLPQHDSLWETGMGMGKAERGMPRPLPFHETREYFLPPAGDGPRERAISWTLANFTW